MADVYSNVQKRQATFKKSLHLTRTLDARCPDVKFVHKNSLCFMERIIFQMLSCLYFYDSGIEVPVCIRKSGRSTDYQQERFIPCRRSTDYQPEGSYTVQSVNRLPAALEDCAKSVNRLPASKGLNCYAIYCIRRPNLTQDPVNVGLVPWCDHG